MGKIFPLLTRKAEVLKFYIFTGTCRNTVSFENSEKTVTNISLNFCKNK